MFLKKLSNSSPVAVPFQSPTSHARRPSALGPPAAMGDSGL